MNKQFLRFLCFVCTLTIFISIFPLQAYADSTQSDGMIKVNPEDIFTEDELEAFLESNRALERSEAEEGLTLVSREVYIPETAVLSHLPYYVKVVDTYTSDPVVLNDRSKGMMYWLDVVWNVAIGVKTKYAWVAATILGIEPSIFSSTYRSGDTLTNTTTKVYTRKCYYMYNEHFDADIKYYETAQLVVTEYVDLYTSTSSGEPYRKSGEETYTFYTEHYNDTAWIKEYVIYACENGLICVYDEFP